MEITILNLKHGNYQLVMTTAEGRMSHTDPFRLQEFQTFCDMQKGSISPFEQRKLDVIEKMIEDMELERINPPIAVNA